MHQSINAPTTDEAGHSAARFAILHSYTVVAVWRIIIACTLRARFSPLFKTALTPTAAAAAAAAAEVREADV